MNINWYPGHMKKAKKSIKESLSMVDIVFEVIDARIPFSSQNPMLDSILQGKDRIIVLNKKDLASTKANKIWEEHFKNQGLKPILINSKNKKGIDKLLLMTRELTEDIINSYKKRGVLNRAIRAMVLGVPNVGKSTLINTLLGRRGTRIGDKPGVTRSNQWIKVDNNLELLDTPGILWPEFKNQDIGINLALTGAIKDEVLDKASLALKLIEIISSNYPELLEKRYNLELAGYSSLEIMEEIGRKRGCIISGGEIDYSRVSNILLDEFRKGIIGPITLELP